MKKRVSLGVIIALLVGPVFALADSNPRSRAPVPAAVGEVIENAWPALTAEEHAASVAELKAFAEQTATTLDRPLKMFETKYFLFYSDLPPQQARNWAGLLDKMYARLAEMFAIPKGVNIWRGKALVFVFVNKEDYRRYELEMLNTDPGRTAGMCHSFGTGIVKIAFYRQEEDLAFAHVLVHESVHGFIHRYRTPVPVPSWANEGLAEMVATDLVPQPGRFEHVRASARQMVSLHGGVADFFVLKHIDFWQYPVAEMMCTFMVKENRKNYVEFIKGIKDGMDVKDCFKEKFRVGREQTVRAFERWLGLATLGG